ALPSEEGHVDEKDGSRSPGAGLSAPGATHLPDVDADASTDHEDRTLPDCSRNELGVTIRSPVRRATVTLKCFVLPVTNQSGLATIAAASTGASFTWRISRRAASNRAGDTC